MDTKDTQEFSDRTVELQMHERNSFADIDGFYFTVIAGADFGRVFLLEKTETVLGRSDAADIQVEDEKVSRKHLTISLVKSGAQNNEQIRVVVTDLHSTNGIFINGGRAYEQELRNGDKVTDIEHPLPGRNLIYLAYFLSKELENISSQGCEPLDDRFDVPLYGKSHPIDALQELEDSAEGRSGRRLTTLIGERLVLACQLVSHPALGHRVDQ